MYVCLYVVLYTLCYDEYYIYMISYKSHSVKSGKRYATKALHLHIKNTYTYTNT